MHVELSEQVQDWLRDRWQDVCSPSQVCLHSLREPPRFMRENPEMIRLEVELMGLASKLLVPSAEVPLKLMLSIPLKHQDDALHSP